MSDNNDENCKDSISLEDNKSKNEEQIDVEIEKDKINFDSNKIIDDYIIKETIGKGTFSTVKLGENVKTKQKVAIKILNKEKIKAKEDLNRIKREIKILSMMDHPNIIKTYKITENEKNYYIIMEYCNGGELFNYIVEKEKLEEDEASMFFYQLINALDYIHSLGIAHRDLKPENLLLIENKIIKIIDFGLSNFFNGEKDLETPCGSPSYASPEIIKGEHYNGFSIDIWASGIIMFAMLCGYLPFDDDDEQEEEEDEDEEDEDSKEEVNSGNESKSDDNEVLFQKILEGKVDFPSYLSKNAIDLMKKILVVDPDKRIKMKDIKKHKFYLLGKKNFLLNQREIAAKEITQSLFNNDSLEEKNISKENVINNINHTDELTDKNDQKYIINKKPSPKNEDKKDDEIKINNIIKPILEKKKEDINKKAISENIKEEMIEYEKKLFENYLKKAISIRKRNLIMSKKNSSNKNHNEKNINFSYRLNTINAHPPKAYFNNKNLKKISKNKNNHTLNEIYLNFNLYNIHDTDINKNSSSLLPQKYNNRNILPIPRINHNNNIFYNNDNNKSLIKDSHHNHLTINIPDISSKRRNNTENKLLKDVKYCITNRKHKNFDELNNRINYFKVPNLNSIGNKNYIFREKTKKPFLPIIKPSLFNIFRNSSINQNKDSSFLNPTLHLKTESTNNTRKRILFNELKNDYSALKNNNIITNSLNNGLRYKLFYPKYKKYN